MLFLMREAFQVKKWKIYFDGMLTLPLLQYHVTLQCYTMFLFPKNPIYLRALHYWFLRWLWWNLGSKILIKLVESWKTLFISEEIVNNDIWIWGSVTLSFHIDYNYIFYFLIYLVIRFFLGYFLRLKSHIHKFN